MFFIQPPYEVSDLTDLLQDAITDPVLGPVIRNFPLASKTGRYQAERIVTQVREQQRQQKLYDANLDAFPVSWNHRKPTGGYRYVVT